MFSQSLDFKKNVGFVPPGSDSERFIGSTPEVDAEWNQLVKDRYFLLSDEEAKEAYGHNIAPYWNGFHGGYVAGLDVLHTLHCLNRLRLMIYPQVYGEKSEESRNAQAHNAHCLDHLRQLAMCHSDLTPIPTQFFPGIQRNYINSSREHTCRSFQHVRDWATERFNGSTAIKARHRNGETFESANRETVLTI